uniref:Uncharacterized protein n=1 Tax=Romanomermis culicivorax TaxID=13658 RepID=A0A915HT85_ROMCU
MDDSISSSNSNLMSIVLIYVSTFAVGSLIIVCLTIYCCCQFRLRQKLREMRKLRKKRKTRSSAEFDILPRLVTDEEASAGGIGGDKKASASAKSKKTEFSDTGGKSKASLVSASSMTSRAAINTSFRKKKITFEKQPRLHFYLLSLLLEKPPSLSENSGQVHVHHSNQKLFCGDSCMSENK